MEHSAKPIEYYIEQDYIDVGGRAHVKIETHRYDDIPNNCWVVTSYVLAYDEVTGVFETMNTIYKPIKDKTTMTDEQGITGLVFLNNKTQAKYVVLSETVIDCTNRNAGCQMVLYKSLSITKSCWYVRDRQEFLEKFTLFVAE